MIVIRRILALGLAALLLAAGCSGNDDDEDTTNSSAPVETGESTESDTTHDEGLVATVTVSQLDDGLEPDSVAAVLESRLATIGAEAEVTIHPTEGDASSATIDIWLSDDSEAPSRYKDLLTSNGSVELRPVVVETLASDPECDVEATTDGDAVVEYKLGHGDDAANCYGVGPLSGSDTSEVLSGQVFAEASAEIGTAGQWVIAATVEPGLVDSFRALTEECLGRGSACETGRLAIVVGESVLSAPTVQAELSNEVVIHGLFTERQAQDLAAIIGAGPIDAVLELSGVVECPC